MEARAGGEPEDDGPANYAFKKRRSFDIVDHEIGRSKTLTLEAKMMLTLALGLPNGFRLSAERFVAQFCHPSEGRKKILRIMSELEALGHLRRIRTQGERGRWRTRNEWYEDPRDNPAHPSNPVNQALAAAGAATDARPVDNAALDTDSPKSPYGTSVTDDAKAQVGPKAPHRTSVDGTSADGTSVEGTIEKELGRRTTNPLTPAGLSAAAAQHDNGGHSPPAPRPSEDEGSDPRKGRSARRSRQDGRNPRALGTNPRAKAQKAAEAAKRVEVLQAARRYGAQVAALEPHLDEAALRQRIADDAARDPVHAWDPERTETCIAGLQTERAKLSHAPPIDAVDQGTSNERGSALAARVARIAQRGVPHAHDFTGRT